MAGKKANKNRGYQRGTLTGKDCASTRRAKRPRKALTELQENFCLAYAAQGFCNGVGALEEAGSRASYASRCSLASRWLRKDKVKARLKQLSVQADRRASKEEKKAVASLAERRARLSDIARAQASDLKGIALEGDRLVFEDESLRSAVKVKAYVRMVVNPNFDPEDDTSPKRVPALVIDLELHDPIKAIQELNRMDGVYKEQAALPAEIHIHTGAKRVLEHDANTAAQLADGSLRVAIPGSDTDKARVKGSISGKLDPFAALCARCHTAQKKNADDSRKT